MNQCYARKVGSATISAAARTAIVAAVTGKSLWVESITITPSDAAKEVPGGVTVSITDEDGTALTSAIPSFAVGAEPINVKYAPGQHIAVVSKGISATPSTADAVGVDIVASYI